jgi:sulfite exporter TauE/SafE
MRRLHLLDLGSNFSHFQFTPVAALAIFGASIAGSLHCVGMCGGLMLTATGTKLHTQFVYHLFRWLGYLTVGVFAGYLGNQLFYDWQWLPFQIFFSSVFLLILLAVGLSYFFGWGGLDQMGVSKSISKFSQFGIQLGFKFGKSDGSVIRAALVGFFTVFLPCGWLYSFVLLAVATHSVVYAGLTLTLFWLGTLPALMSSRIIIQGVMSKIGVSGTRIISVLMICAAFFSVYEHWKGITQKATSLNSAQDLNCHSSP